MWLGITILPVIFAMVMGVILSFIKMVFWLMQATRLPLWVRRKYSRRLRQPRLNVINDSDTLTDKIAKKLSNQSKLFRHYFLARWTVPFAREQMEQMLDTMANAVITILSIYYMTGCSKALTVFPNLCLETDFVEITNNVTGDSSMQPRRRQLAGTFRGQVVCFERELASDNYTLSPWVSPGIWTESPNEFPIPTPPYYIIAGIGYFFFFGYAIGIPVFIGTTLYRGRHKLNEQRFGRKFGYLYKRYEVGWFAWEIMVMMRKVMLAIIKVVVRLPNGKPMPIQQSAAGMVVLITFLCAQAFAMPFAEYHLDILETVLLTWYAFGAFPFPPHPTILAPHRSLHHHHRSASLCSNQQGCPPDGRTYGRASARSNYIFLFMGLCNFMVDTQSPLYAPDRELKPLLIFIMYAVLLVGGIFIIFMVTLDITLQAVRLYFRFIEGEGRYGEHQQLVLRKLGADAVRIQQMGVRFIDREKRQQFNNWLNKRATQEERFLLDAAFSSLGYYIDHHAEHSKPLIVRYFKEVPLIGRALNFLWAQRVKQRIAARDRARERKRKRKQKLKRKADAARAEALGLDPADLEGQESSMAERTRTRGGSGPSSGTDGGAGVGPCQSSRRGLDHFVPKRTGSRTSSDEGRRGGGTSTSEAEGGRAEPQSTDTSALSPFSLPMTDNSEAEGTPRSREGGPESAASCRRSVSRDSDGGADAPLTLASKSSSARLVASESSHVRGGDSDTSRSSTSDNEDAVLALQIRTAERAASNRATREALRLHMTPQEAAKEIKKAERYARKAVREAYEQERDKGSTEVTAYHRDLLVALGGSSSPVIKDLPRPSSPPNSPPSREPPTAPPPANARLGGSTRE